MRDPKFLLKVQKALEEAQAGIERGLRKGLNDPEALTRGLRALTALREATEILAQGLASPAGGVGETGVPWREIPLEPAPSTPRTTPRRIRRRREVRPRPGPAARRAGP